MIRTYFLFLLVFGAACSSQTEEKNEEENFVLENLRTIKHIDKGNIKLQMIESKMPVGFKTLTSHYLVIQKYNGDNLLEEREFNIEEGDTIKRSHLRNHYDENNNLVFTKDSVANLSVRTSEFTYENGLKIKEISNSIMFQTDYLSDRIIRIDTMKSVVYSYHDKNNILINNKAISWDNGISRLKANAPDTSFSYHYYDQSGNRIKTVTLSNSDTTSVALSEFDNKNRNIQMIDYSKEFGMNVMKFEYDEIGNRKTEVLINEFGHMRTEYKYDDKNRVIKETFYKKNQNFN